MNSIGPTSGDLFESVEKVKYFGYCFIAKLSKSGAKQSAILAAQSIAEEHS